MRNIATKRLTREESLETERLFKKYERFIQGVALKIAAITGVPSEDLVQEGFIGLVKARETYDPGKSAFLTYAQYWIKLAMRSYAYSFQFQMSIPPAFFGIYSRYCSLSSKGLSMAKIADELSISENSLSNAVHAIQAVKCMGVVGDTLDVKETTNAIGQFCAEHDSSLFIGIVRKTLTDQEYFILDHLLALDCTQPKTLKWVGEVIGLTKERVRQIKNVALEKLRRTIRSKLCQE
jgi:RNA polymerase primary sigma factor